MATDSSQMLKAQRICFEACFVRLGSRLGGGVWGENIGRGRAIGGYLYDLVFVREDDGEDAGGAEQVLDFEGVEVGVLGRFVVVEHQVQGVGLSAEEEEFEDVVIERA